jgi:hypothetical protein
VLSRVSVASFAGHSGMQEWRSGVAVDGAGGRPLYGTHVTAHTPALHRQRWRPLAQLAESWFHVVVIRRRIPRDWRFKQIISNGVEVSGSEMTGAEEIPQLKLDWRLSCGRIPRGQIGAAIANGNRVLDA